MPPSQQTDPSKNLNQFNKFLQNNIDFLKQKYIQHFKQPFPYTQLQTKTKIQLAIKFIYDVFSFQKYEKDQKMNQTLRKSLRQNILGFLKSSPPKQGVKFNSQDGIKLLKYCIQNNQMFAVHYDKKQKKSQSPVKSQQEKQPHQQNKQQSQQNQPQQKKQQKQQKIEGQNMFQANLSNVSKKSKQTVKEQPKQQVVHVNNNQFSIANKTQQENKHHQILKKQAKVVFDFYCKQQLNAGGPNATFDKISHQSNTMTLGKFMAFANITRILYTTKVQAYKPKNYKVLDKKTINQLFRKISKAQKQIDFQQFFQLIKSLNQVDNTVYDKLNMNKSQTHNKILRKLKYLNTPFNMKGHLQEQSQFIISDKPYIPINTAHSGKFQNSLKQDIQQRKQKLRFLPHQPYPNPNQVKPYDTFLLDSRVRQSSMEQQLMESKIKGGNGFLLHRKGQNKTATDDKKQVSKIRLQNSRISFQDGHKLNEQINVLRGLIVNDDDNDDVFLKDYKIPKLGSNAGLKKKAINNLNTSNRNQQGRQSSARKFSGMKTQRKNVVDQLKQRIIQVEKSQRKQLTGKDNNNRRSISTYNKY